MDIPAELTIASVPGSAPRSAIPFPLRIKSGNTKDVDGFSVSLPPGRYVVVIKASQARCPDGVFVDVPSGGWTRMEIDCAF